MAISLTKGSNLSLSKKDPTMNNVLVGLGWDARLTDGKYFDLDASAFMLKNDGKTRSDANFIFYNQVRLASDSLEQLGPMMSHCYYN